MKKYIKNNSVVKLIVKFFHTTLINPAKSFPGSGEYWKKRYKSGGTSGAGSYDESARFKAKILNRFVKNEKIQSLIELGCGDGNQLKFADYPSYIGFDISEDAVNNCQKGFSGDQSKTFKLLSAYEGEKAELSLSLDVIYHLIEDEVFFNHMNQLFNASSKYVIIYSSNTDQQERLQPAHVRHRNFTRWIEENQPTWKLDEHITNAISYSKDKAAGSFADIYIYSQKRS